MGPCWTRYTGRGRLSAFNGILLSSPDFGDTCDAADGLSCVAVTRRLFENQLSDWGQDRVINVVSAGRTRGPDLT